MARYDGPCKRDCPRRNSRCHIACPEHAEEQAENARRRKTRKAAADVENTRKDSYYNYAEKARRAGGLKNIYHK